MVGQQLDVLFSAAVMGTRGFLESLNPVFFFSEYMGKHFGLGCGKMSS